jgi:hypothetical protein
MTDLLEHLRFAVAKARHRHRTRGTSAPVAVFAIAKSGSSSIAAALRAATGSPLFQVHDLDAARLPEEEATYRWSGRPWRVWDAQQLLRHPPTTARPWRIVSLVRDPIAQSVSAFFQPAVRKGYITPTTTLADLQAGFADRLDRLALGWFESHVEPALGIDVYASTFDPSAGYQIISTGSVRLLLLRCEDLASAPNGLAELLGVDHPVPVPKVNVGADKDYGELYAAFLGSLRPTRAQLDDAYSSRLVRHFYSPTEIDRFRARWTVQSPSEVDPRGTGDQVHR